MFLCVCLFLRLVSSIHAIMATTAGVIVVSSCHGNVINDRLDFMSLIPLVKQWLQVAAHILYVWFPWFPTQSLHFLTCTHQGHVGWLGARNFFFLTTEGSLRECSTLEIWRDDFHWRGEVEKGLTLSKFPLMSGSNSLATTKSRLYSLNRRKKNSTT